MAIEVLLVGAAAAVAAVLFARTFPGAATTVVHVRIAVAAIASLVIGAILISTNVPVLMLVGAVVIFLLVLSAVVLDPEPVW